MHTKENIIKQIFFDKNHNWGNFVKLHLKSIRKIVLEEVEKFRLCGEKEAGFSMYACECCGEIKIVPHCCKGRFCSVCATGYMQEWSTKTAENLYNMPHRHIMFTMPEDKAYSDNDEGFVVYGPPNKSKGGIEEQVGYIDQYMRRPAIALRRILSYFFKNELIE